MKLPPVQKLSYPKVMYGKYHSGNVSSDTYKVLKITVIYLVEPVTNVF